MAEAANLAAKYGGMWLRGALAKQRNQAQTRLHPVFVGMVGYLHVAGCAAWVRMLTRTSTACLARPAAVGAVCCF